MMSGVIEFIRDQAEKAPQEILWAAAAAYAVHRCERRRDNRVHPPRHAAGQR